MKVKLSRNYTCAPEGHTTLTFTAGQVLEGVAAAMALADKAGVEIAVMDPLETKVTPPTEAKAPAKPRARKG